MAYLALHFCGTHHVELWQSYFAHHLLEKPKICVRGKTTGAFINSTGSFQWTPAVVALSLLFINHKLTSEICEDGSYSVIIGSRGSITSSLNYAIEKAPNWLAEMFGTCSRGDLLFKKLVKRSNSNFKCAAPMAISLNPKAIKADAIDIILNNELITTPQELEVVFQRLVKSLPKKKIPRFNGFLEISDPELHSN